MEGVRSTALSQQPLFIHCDSGLRCSPLMALLAIVTRGGDFDHAQRAIEAAMLQQYEHPRSPFWSEADLSVVAAFLDECATKQNDSDVVELPELESRLDLPGYLARNGLTEQGVEVGVGSGWFSYHLLRHSTLSRLYSVDPWCYPQGSGEACLAEESRYLETVRNLAPFGLRSVVLRMTSAEAARLFQPASLDCVYIDANHEYAFVRSDIQIWASKIRRGGILAGHDYSEQTPDVRRAAQEFAAATGRTLYLTRLDEECDGKPVRSWMFLM